MEEIQKALSEAWRNAAPRPEPKYLNNAVMTFMILASIWTGYYLHHATWRPADIDQLLTRSTYIAAQVTNTSLAEVQTKVERRIGKRMDMFSAADQATALDFIFDGIEQHQFRQSAYD